MKLLLCDYVVTHNGKPHADEFLSIGMAVHAGVIDVAAPVFRRNPTPTELEDPNVLVLDVGMRLDWPRRCIDHHQPGTEGECTLSLLAKCIERGAGVPSYWDLLKDLPWFRGVILGDTGGPGGFASLAGIRKLPPELLDDPFRRFALDSWAAAPGVAAPTAMFYWAYTQAQERHNVFQRMTKEAKIASTSSLPGLVILVPEGINPLLASAWMAENTPGAVVSITPNDRGAGRKLYRVPGNEGRIDFRLAPAVAEAYGGKVTFAHPTGFLAVWEGPLEGALEVIERCCLSKAA